MTIVEVYTSPAEGKASRSAAVTCAGEAGDVYTGKMFQRTHRPLHLSAGAKAMKVNP